MFFGTDLLSYFTLLVELVNSSKCRLSVLASCAFVGHMLYTFLTMLITARHFVPNHRRWDEDYVQVYPVQGVLFMAVMLVLIFAIAFSILRPDKLSISQWPAMRILATGAWLAIAGLFIGILFVMHHPNYVAASCFALFNAFPLAMLSALMLKLVHWQRGLSSP